jgi:HAD superfamily phosphoserine phosphatase-like hydrolase
MIAFFDIDGTLLPNPSLELRLLWDLFQRGRIPSGNYFRWAAGMFRCDARNLRLSALANKMYLRGLPAGVFSDAAARLSPEFFPAAMQRVWWHALRGDAVVLVSGTLLPLGEIVKAALQRELRWRGIEGSIAVLATRLEFNGGSSTGKVQGTPMFGRAKALAIRALARARGIALEQCSAYGDHELDCAMLASVGAAFAVNPSPALRRAAQLHGWRVVDWQPRTPRTARQAVHSKGEAG